MSCHVHCATPTYSVVLYETFCQVKLSTMCLTLKNQQIPRKQYYGLNWKVQTKEIGLVCCWAHDSH